MQERCLSRRILLIIRHSQILPFSKQINFTLVRISLICGSDDTCFFVPFLSVQFSLSLLLWLSPPHCDPNRNWKTNALSQFFSSCAVFPEHRKRCFGFVAESLPNTQTQKGVLVSRKGLAKTESSQCRCISCDQNLRNESVSSRDTAKLP